MANAFDLERYFAKQPDVFDKSGIDFSSDNNALVIDQPDNTVVVRFDPKEGRDDTETAKSDHDANLAEFVDDGELNRLAENLLEGIQEDDRSRQEWLLARSNGLKILGVRIEEPRSDLASSSAPMEGMSTVRHPLLLSAVLNFQATARGELLPADGPAKTRNWGDETATTDKLAEVLEKTVNFFLTKTATEYIPDTDRMLFMIGYSGMSFKKVFKCPIRRRPVSECVDAEHLIVNNTAVDLQTAGRVTHEIPMSQVTFKRMQLAGVYRDVDLIPPDPNINPMDASKARVEGINLNVTRPEDQMRTIYECYTDIDLAGFEHERDGEPTGLPLPYRVTIEKTSRQILEIRRDWKIDDEDFIRRRTFVPFGFVPYMGFYNIGLLQILGNSSMALTGAWRLLLDAGMFSNFPGFLVAKTGARQVNNNFRVPPGGGVPVDVTGDRKLQDSVMPMPYKGPDPALMQLADNIAAQSERLAGTAELPTADGSVAVPVGTILAAIERSDITLNAVHKRLHAAQGLELELIRDLLREDPEALWRGTPNHMGWNEQLVLQALNSYSIVPRSDPNTPSHVHRLMKATALAQIAQQSPPGIFEPRAVLTRVLSMMRIDDPESLFLPPEQANAQPNPDLMMAQSQAEGNRLKAQAAQNTNQLKLLDIQSRERQTAAKLLAQRQMEGMRIAERLAVHPQSVGEVANVMAPTSTPQGTTP